jgi:hypothetical protein
MEKIDLLISLLTQAKEIATKEPWITEDMLRRGLSRDKILELYGLTIGLYDHVSDSVSHYNHITKTV